MHIFGKNVQSLQTESRTEELFEELQLLSWDIVLLSETWREASHERWRTEEGHLFLGSGGKKGEKGVGVIVNRKWTQGLQKFRSVNERICYIDINIMSRRFKFIAVYMPHGGCDDDDVDGTYVLLDDVVTQSRREQRTCILVGDFNAVVGRCKPGDDGDIIGDYGLGSRNERGEWLLQWATSHRLAIASTQFLKEEANQWTHQNGTRRRQIDYCLISMEKLPMITDADACEDIAVGVDHRTVKITMGITSIRHSTRKRRKKMRGWVPVDKEDFQTKMDAKLKELVYDENMHQSLEKKCQDIEQILLEIGKQCMKETDAPKDKEDKEKLRELIQKRRRALKEQDKNEVKVTSKAIQKEMKAIKRARRTAKITEVLTEYKDLRRLQHIKSDGKVKCIGSMIDKNGVEKSEHEDVANVFADFFESLYEDVSFDRPAYPNLAEIPDVQVSELQEQLTRMKAKKAADDDGIVAELLKSSSEDMLRIIAKLFTAIMKPESEIPEYWKKSTIRVLFKKGDCKMPDNYRPISIIPIVYKLFSKVLVGRMKKTLDDQQSPDQAGFRSDFSCDDNLFTITMVAEKCKEFNLPLWVAALDFRKAFDSIYHRSILEALSKQLVPDAYVDIIRRLYEGQRARVWCECFSREFEIKKGAKQGDPISSYLFNAVLEDVMRKVKVKWKKRGYGIEVDYGKNEESLTNLRFADDILLTARSLPQIKQMLADVAEECESVGLALHPEKTKIQHNDIGYGSRVRQAKVKGLEVEVLAPDDHTIYLGKALNLVDMHDVELKHRIRKAWSKFGLLKTELTDRLVPLRLRMRLFNAVINPTMLYSCSSWAMTENRTKSLRTTQARMLRCMSSSRRRVEEDGQLESWSTWIQRETHKAREYMKKYKVDDWADVQDTRRRSWSKRLERMEEQRWSKKVLEWQPLGQRSQGRPRKRW